jgi:hypothetical protein
VAEGKFVSYLRVSTARQGRSGLGLEAQRKAVTDFLDGGNWTLVKEFVEVESGKKADRPELQKAFQACRVFGARLVIAKLDRLSRLLLRLCRKRPRNRRAAERCDELAPFHVRPKHRRDHLIGSNEYFDRVTLCAGLWPSPYELRNRQNNSRTVVRPHVRKPCENAEKNLSAHGKIVSFHPLSTSPTKNC